jgi:hypothetical protein
MATHKDTVNFNILSGKFIQIKPLHTGSTPDVVTLPLSCLYLHTCFFRVYQGSDLGDEEKQFAAITWEVLNIIKENFPSKVSLK